jgi:hypothetical protein
MNINCGTTGYLAYRIHRPFADRRPNKTECDFQTNLLGLAPRALPVRAAARHIRKRNHEPSLDHNRLRKNTRGEFCAVMRKRATNSRSRHHRCLSPCVPSREFCISSNDKPSSQGSRRSPSLPSVAKPFVSSCLRGSSHAKNPRRRRKPRRLLSPLARHFGQKSPIFVTAEFKDHREFQPSWLRRVDKTFDFCPKNRLRAQRTKITVPISLRERRFVLPREMPTFPSLQPPIHRLFPNPVSYMMLGSSDASCWSAMLPAGQRGLNLFPHNIRRIQAPLRAESRGPENSSGPPLEVYPPWRALRLPPPLLWLTAT